MFRKSSKNAPKLLRQPKLFNCIKFKSIELEKLLKNSRKCSKNHPKFFTNHRKCSKIHSKMLQNSYDSQNCLFASNLNQIYLKNCSQISENVPKIIQNSPKVIQNSFKTPATAKTVQFHKVWTKCIGKTFQKSSKKRQKSCDQLHQLLMKSIGKALDQSWKNREKLCDSVPIHRGEQQTNKKSCW